MREKLDIKKQIGFTYKMAEKIQKTAEGLNVSFPEIVRECVYRELDRLIDRETKRKQAQQNKE